MRFSIFIFSTVLVVLITARYFHRLRDIRLESGFCSGYQELKDNKCSARLSYCSSPLNPIELTTMRQILCGFRFDPSVQSDPPSGVSNSAYYPRPFLEVFETDIHSYRFMASIYTSDRKFLCVGALISPKTVITSAQCVLQSRRRKKRQEEEAQTPEEGQAPEGESPEGQPPETPTDGSSRLIVRLGEQHLNINPSFKKVYEYDVESQEIIEQYDGPTYQNDIAIIRLVSAVPICLFPPVYIPRRFEWWLDYYHINGCSAKYLGWGLKNQRPYLRSQSGEVLPQYICQKLFNWDFNQLNRSHICVDSPSGVCVTDIGGPLITYTHNRWVLIGIMSFGKHCGTPGLPLIFSRITENLDFITKFVEQDFLSRNATFHHKECYLYRNPFLPIKKHVPLYPIKSYKPLPHYSIKSYKPLPIFPIKSLPLYPIESDNILQLNPIKETVPIPFPEDGIHEFEGQVPSDLTQGNVIPNKHIDYELLK